MANVQVGVLNLLMPTAQPASGRAAVTDTKRSSAKVPAQVDVAEDAATAAKTRAAKDRAAKAQAEMAKGSVAVPLVTPGLGDGCPTNGVQPRAMQVAKGMTADKPAGRAKAAQNSAGPVNAGSPGTFGALVERLTHSHGAGEPSQNSFRDTGLSSILNSGTGATRPPGGPATAAEPGSFSARTANKTGSAALAREGKSAARTASAFVATTAAPQAQRLPAGPAAQAMPAAQTSHVVAVTRVAPPTEAAQAMAPSLAGGDRLQATLTARPTAKWSKPVPATTNPAARQTTREPGTLATAGQAGASATARVATLAHRSDIPTVTPSEQKGSKSPAAPEAAGDAEAAKPFAGPGRPTARQTAAAPTEAAQAGQQATGGKSQSSGKAASSVRPLEAAEGVELTAAGQSAGRPTATGAADGLGQVGLGGAADRPRIGEQIAEQVRGQTVRAGEQITIHLEPPQLGRVRLTLEADGQAVRGVLEVDNPRALLELQRETPALAERLADGGIELLRLDVQLSEQARQDLSGSAQQQQQQYAAGGQGTSQRHEGQAPADGPAGDTGPATGAEAGGGDEPRRADRLAGGSINVWM